jgi:hypothetical protein
MNISLLRFKEIMLYGRVACDETKKQPGKFSSFLLLSIWRLSGKSIFHNGETAMYCGLFSPQRVKAG